jgi:hypothetical protein
MGELFLVRHCHLLLGSKLFRYVGAPFQRSTNWISRHCLSCSSILCKNYLAARCRAHHPTAPALVYSRLDPRSGNRQPQFWYSSQPNTDCGFHRDVFNSAPLGLSRSAYTDCTLKDAKPHMEAAKLRSVVAWRYLMQVLTGCMYRLYSSKARANATAPRMQ